MFKIEILALFVYPFSFKRLTPTILHFYMSKHRLLSFYSPSRNRTFDKVEPEANAACLFPPARAHISPLKQVNGAVRSSRAHRAPNVFEEQMRGEIQASRAVSSHVTWETIMTFSVDF